MGYKIGFSLGYGIVFLAYTAILCLLTGFAQPGAWMGLACTALVLGLCLAAVWKDVFRAGIAHLRMALGAVVTIFFLLQLVMGIVVCFLPVLWGAILEIVLMAVCLLCTGGTLLGGRMIADREQELRDRRQTSEKWDSEEARDDL